MQSEGSFPEEHRGRRPPPSTSPPCPTWFFRLRSPFFRGSKTPVQERFAPLQLLALVQLAQKRPPDVQPNAPLLPVSQPPPADRGMREFLRQVLPAGPAPQNPQNPFQHTAVLNPGTTALALFGRLGEQGRDLLPLRFGQQRTRSGHRPSLGAANSPYLSSQKIQLPSFQDSVLGYATASRNYSKEKYCDSRYFHSQVHALANYIGTMNIKSLPNSADRDDKDQTPPTHSTVIHMDRS